jgi:hypothetical protein
MAKLGRSFVQLSAEAFQYRDAVRFNNGREVLLQGLTCGQRVEVLRLAPGDASENERAHERLEDDYRRVFS